MFLDFYFKFFQSLRYHVVFNSRLVCKILEKSPQQNLNITLEVHEKKAGGAYTIDGVARSHGFSFVVRIT